MAAARAHRRRAAVALAPLGLHPGQELLLSILHKRGSATQVQLARILSVEPPTVAKMLGRLEAAGFTQRTADPEDSRAKRVTLTELGQQTAQRVTVVWSELSEQTEAALTPDEVEQLTSLLTRVAARLEREPGE